MDKERVLVAEHDPTFLERVARRLKQMGMRVDGAQDGKTALEKLESRRYDLLVLDIAMPVIGGLEILRMAKDSDPHLPVIVTTFKGSVEWARQAIQGGATSYLVRPFEDMTAFDKAVAEALRQAPSSQPQRPDPVKPSSTHFDPSERILSKRVSLLLRRHEELVEVLERLPVGVLELDERGGMISCNRVARNWLANESSGQRNPIQEFLELLRTTGEESSNEVEIDGQWLRLTASQLPTKDGNERTMVVIQDQMEIAVAAPAEVRAYSMPKLDLGSVKVMQFKRGLAQRARALPVALFRLAARLARFLFQQARRVPTLVSHVNHRVRSRHSADEKARVQQRLYELFGAVNHEALIDMEPAVAVRLASLSASPQPPSTHAAGRSATAAASYRAPFARPNLHPSR